MSKDKLGFDGKCQAMKNQVLHLGKLVRKFPGDPVIYCKFNKIKKDFKKLLKKNRREAKENY